MNLTWIWTLQWLCQQVYSQLTQTSETRVCVYSNLYLTRKDPKCWKLIQPCKRSTGVNSTLFYSQRRTALTFQCRNRNTLRVELCPRLWHTGNCPGFSQWQAFPTSSLPELWPVSLPATQVRIRIQGLNHPRESLSEPSPVAVCGRVAGASNTESSEWRVWPR